MQVLQYLWQPVKKFSRGMIAIFAVNLLLVGCLFLFDSCRKANYENSANGQARSRFLNAIETNKKTVGAAVLQPGKIRVSGTPAASTEARAAFDETSGMEPVYLEYPEGTDTATKNLIYSTTNLQQLSDLVGQTDAIVQYEPTATNAEYQLDVPIEAVENSLKPLIEEAKQYLYTKGFTEQDIQDMLVEESGKEEDLIPFVMALTMAENTQPLARNYTSSFITSAHAKIDANEYIECAIKAIGADVIYALGAGPSSWTIAAMKKAFGTVAKRLLGPIGVGIAVVSFGLCIVDAYYD